MTIDFKRYLCMMLVPEAGPKASKNVCINEGVIERGNDANEVLCFSLGQNSFVCPDVRISGCLAVLLYRGLSRNFKGRLLVLQLRGQLAK
jgi:hypothetical protein